MYFKCFLLFSATSLVASKRVPDLTELYKESRIVNGVTEVIENAPWQISLQYKGRHICGGSIYSENIILTAAHCILKMCLKDFMVRVGSNNHDVGGTLVEVAQIVIHECYNKEPFLKDIAILKLSENLTFDASVKPIALAEETPQIDAIATVTGWGKTRQLGDTRTNLQSVQLRIKKPNVCSHLVWHTNTRDMVCAYGWCKGPCKGDFGGPLVVNGQLVGLTSVVQRSCKGPSLFVNVVELSPWILKKAQSLSNEVTTAKPQGLPDNTTKSLY